jgi:glycosyltransferase involved in cell wall biosynthesis
VRVGLCIYGSLDLVSGGFLYDRMVVRELRAAGVDVQVIARPWRRYGAALADNLRPGPTPDVDVILEDQLIHPSVFAGGPGGPPIVALVHNLTCPPGTPSLRAAIERRYFSRVAGVVAVCANTLSEVRAHTGAPAVVARAGRDHVPESLQVARPRAGPLRLLFVGAVMPHKGLHRLLAALAPLSAPWTLDVVGSLTADPAYAARLRAHADARVRWHGEQSGEALWAHHRAAALFVLPSDREAYSIAALEALGFGLPVLATARGGMGELIGPGEGLTLPPDDVAAWTAAVAQLAADPARLAALSAGARARFAAHGTWRDTAAVIRALLEQILARSRG